MRPLVLLVLLALVSCAEPAVVEPLEPRAAAVAAPENEGSARARLVVVVVFDQLASWTLAKLLPHLPEDGLVKRGIARGSFVERVRYGYASTNTAPGHAAIFTGASPSVSGITANSIIDADTGKERPFVSDGRHPVLGREGATASPLALRVDTVGDVLEGVSADRAKVVSLSVKDRSAVLSGGRGADVALWYDHRVPGFTSSTYYGARLPGWLERWQAAHPIAELLKVWEPADRELLARVAGPDDAAGEGDFMGLGRAFPHRIGEAEQPYDALRMSPALTDRLLALAREAATELALGQDEHVDLLAISISGPDYAGHTWGPDSWEYLDHVLRADRAAGELLAWLEARAPTAVLMTSDHGVAPLPERAGEGGRLFPDEIAARAAAAAEKALGKGGVRGFVRPFVYLTPELSADERRRAADAIAAALSGMPGVHLAIAVERARVWAGDPDPVKRGVAASLAEGLPGEVYVVPARGWVVDERRPRGAGTTHGTPWSFDAEVPVVFWGPGVARHREREVLDQDRVAATIAALAGVPAPEHLRAKPLPGAR